jgi:hypothetical protein
MIVELPKNINLIAKGIDVLNQQNLKRNYKIDNTQLVQDSEGNVVYREPHSFYRSFGLLIHPFTKKPVERLTGYQYDWWNSILDNKYNIAVKSNKIGLSSSTLIGVFQNCLLRESAGNEKLLIAQTHQMAKEHLYTLRQMILNSPTFRTSLIMRPGKYLLKDEVSKVTQLFIHNPYNPPKPTRIIALGASAASSVSWKNVDLIYISDITKAQFDYTEVIDGAFTRLAMSRGRFIIETIPRGPKGKVYEIWQNAVSGKNDFKWFKFPIELAIDAGLVSQKFIDSERARLGAFFPEYYGAEFISVGGNVFHPGHIQRAMELAKALPGYDISYGVDYPKSMGVDPAFGSDSMFAIVVTQKRNNLIEVIFAEEFQGMDHQMMCNMISNMMHRMNITKVYVDMQMQSVSDKLKQMQNDEVNPDENRKSIPLNDIRFKPYKINPIAFGRYGMQMIQLAQRIFSENLIAIDGLRFNNLITQLKTATLVNPSGDRPELDKQTYGTMDMFDAFRLSLCNYGFDRPNENQYT